MSVFHRVARFGFRMLSLIVLGLLTMASMHFLASVCFKGTMIGNILFALADGVASPGNPLYPPMPLVPYLLFSSLYAFTFGLLVCAGCRAGSRVVRLKMLPIVFVGMLTWCLFRIFFLNNEGTESEMLDFLNSIDNHETVSSLSPRIPHSLLSRYSFPVAVWDFESILEHSGRYFKVPLSDTPSLKIPLSCRFHLKDEASLANSRSGFGWVDVLLFFSEDERLTGVHLVVSYDSPFGFERNVLTDWSPNWADDSDSGE